MECGQSIGFDHDIEKISEGNEGVVAVRQCRILGILKGVFTALTGCEYQLTCDSLKEN